MQFIDQRQGRWHVFIYEARHPPGWCGVVSYDDAEKPSYRTHTSTLEEAAERCASFMVREAEQLDALANRVRTLLAVNKERLAQVGLD